MRSLFAAAAAAAVVLSGSVASADVLYGIDIGDGSIFTLDTDTAAMQKYFGHPVNNFGGLDFDGAGNLYLEQFGSLYQIVLGVSSTQIGGNNGRAFESFEILNGVAYSADVFDGGIYTIDLTNNNATLVGFHGDTNTRITGLASDETGALFGARIFQGDIVKVNPANGQITGTIASGLPGSVTSLALGSQNNLWFIPAFETTLYSVDIATGQVTPVLFNLNVSHVTGLATVPAPGAVALLAVAGIAVVRRRR